MPKVKQIWHVGKVYITRPHHVVISSDEITGMAVICKYAPASVDICIFRHFRFLPAWLSVS